MKKRKIHILNFNKKQIFVCPYSNLFISYVVVFMQKKMNSLKRKYEKISKLYEDEKTKKEILNEKIIQLNKKIINLTKELNEEQNKLQILDESVKLKKKLSFGFKYKLFIYEKEFESLGFCTNFFEIIFEYSLTQFLLYKDCLYVDDELDVAEDNFYTIYGGQVYDSILLEPTQIYKQVGNVCDTCGNNIDDMEHLYCTISVNFGYIFGCLTTNCFVISSGFTNVPDKSYAFRDIFKDKWNPYDLKNLFIHNTKCKFQIYKTKTNSSYFNFST